MAHNASSIKFENWRLASCFVTSLKSYQHGSSDVKLFLVLCDVNMHIHQVILFITLFNLTNYISHPFKLLLCSSHPDEVNLTHNIFHDTIIEIRQNRTVIPLLSRHVANLFTNHALVAFNFRAVGNVLENGSKRCDAYATSH